MPSGTVCGLLLLYRVLAVALAMDAFPRLTLLAWRQSHCLCPCLPHTKHSLLSYQRFRSAFTPATLALSRESCSSAALPCGLVPATATNLAPRHFAVCRRPASLASITAWFHCCLALMLNNVSGSALRNRIPYYFLLCGGTRVAPFPPLLPQPAPCHALACTAVRRASPPP